MAQIIDGKAIASQVLSEVRERVHLLRDKAVTPALAAILVGDDPASERYVASKRKDAEKIGIGSQLFRMSPQAEAGELASLIDDLNSDSSFHGILLQLPLPKHLDQDVFLSRIDPSKDVDGLHPYSAGLLAQGSPRFVPCTPLGVQQMLVRTGVELDGRHVVVVGRSALVGRPLSTLLSLKGPGGNATVTLCHTGTRDLAFHTRRADVLVVAAGMENTIGAVHVHDKMVVVDVGTNFPEAGRQVGDVAFDEVEPVVAAISPSPGGVGPMTRAMLLSNTVLAAELSA